MKYGSDLVVISRDEEGWDERTLKNLRYCFARAVNRGLWLVNGCKHNNKRELCVFVLPHLQLPLDVNILLSSLPSSASDGFSVS